MSNTTVYTIPARPTTYNGVKMRSRLEATFAGLLDQWGMNWQYEPHCYADETGQYLPDFQIDDLWLPRGERYIGGKMKAPLFIETKPVDLVFNLDDPYAEGKIEERMLVIRSTVPRASLGIWFQEEPWFLFNLSSDPGMWYPAYFMACPDCGRRFVLSELWLHETKQWACQPQHSGLTYLTSKATY